MKNNVLRAPLIKSAILLVIFSLLVYFTSTSAEGSIWNSIGMIFVSAFKIAQLAVGLMLSLALCLIVLCGIFLGSVAMVSKENATSMYHNLLEKVRSSFQFLHIKGCTDRAAEQEALKNEIYGILTNRLNEIKKSQAEQYLQICTLADKIEKLEQNCSVLVSAELLENTLAEVSEKNVQLIGDFPHVKKIVNKLEQQIGQLSRDSLLGDLPAQVKALEEKSSQDDTFEELQQQIESLQTEFSEIKTLTKEIHLQLEDVIALKTEPSETPGTDKKKDEIICRICSYFTDADDCDQLTQLVGETLEKDMTYAQVSEYVIDKISRNAAEVVREHPALMKDYIRQRRQEYEG